MKSLIKKTAKCSSLVTFLRLVSEKLQRIVQHNGGRSALKAASWLNTVKQNKLHRCNTLTIFRKQKLCNISFPEILIQVFLPSQLSI